MDQSLVRSLASMASRLSPQARAGVLSLLPKDLADAVTQSPPAHPADGDAGIGGDAPDPAGGVELPPLLLALLLLNSQPPAAASLLVQLPPPLQGKAINCIVTGTAMGVTRGLGEDASQVKSLRSQLGGAEDWGPESAGRILRATENTPQIQGVIAASAEDDERAAKILQSHLFRFEDIVRLEDRELQTLLARTDNATLAEAMCMTSDAAKERILENMSARRAGLVQDEAELYADATAEEVAGAQGRVLSTARLLYDNGAISTYLGSIESQPRLSGVEDIETPADGGRGSGPPPPADKGVRPARKRRAADRSKRLLMVTGVSAAAIIAIVALVLSMRGLSPQSTDGDSGSQDRGSRSRRAGGGSQGTSGSDARVLVRSGEEAPATLGERGQPTERFDLVPGQALRVPEEIEAVLELPGKDGDKAASVLAGPDSEVQLSSASVDAMGAPGPAGDAAEDASPGVLHLRVGRLRVTVIKSGFAVQTPVLRAVGDAGAVFGVRVVLDASTTVAVEKGSVVVSELADGGRTFSLTAGQRVRLDSRGRWQVDDS